MKTFTTFSIFLLATGLSARSQVILNPQASSLPAATQPGFGFTAGAASVLAGLGPNGDILDLLTVLGQQDLPLTDTNGVVLTTADLSASLIRAQAALQQALPMLQSLNDTVEFPPPVGTIPASSVSASGSGFGLGSLAANANRDGALTPPSVTTATPASTTIPNTSVDQAARDTVRALTVLQADIERLLPMLNALNGGTNTITIPIVGDGGAAASTAIVAPPGPAMMPSAPAMTPTLPAASAGP